jgi:hypothetical protein
MTLAEMEIADQQFRIHERAVKHLVKTEHKRLMADQSARVRSVQSLCQTLAGTARKRHHESLPLGRTSVYLRAPALSQ